MNLKKTPTGLLSCECKAELDENIGHVTGFACESINGYTYTFQVAYTGRLYTSCAIDKADEAKFTPICEKYRTKPECVNINTVGR